VKLTKEQIMVAESMIERGVSIRTMAKQLGVRDRALRYRLKRQRDGIVDGRRVKPTALDGLEAAVHTLLERFEDVRLTGEGRPAQARQVYEVLCRDFGFTGSYKSVLRHLERTYGRPPVRALRRVETPPGVQAQHDWFQEDTVLAGEPVSLPVMVGTLSHSRGRFPWVSRNADQLAWHTGHLELFGRYGGVPLWVRIDNLSTGVASGAGPTAVLNRVYERFAREVGFEIDPCRAGMGQDKGKTERSVRIFRDQFGDLFSREWPELEALQSALDERAASLLVRLRCPVTGTSVLEALTAERLHLQPLPAMGEPFDVIVSRRVSRDCLVSFEGRRYSVPFIWLGREVEVLGTHGHVVIRAAGQEIARHPRRTPALLVLNPDHYEGESTRSVLAPTPLGRRARLQLAGLSSPSRRALVELAGRSELTRPLSAYIQLVEALV
jgi:transposase